MTRSATQLDDKARLQAVRPARTAIRNVFYCVAQLAKFLRKKNRSGFHQAITLAFHQIGPLTHGGIIAYAKRPVNHSLK